MASFGLNHTRAARSESPWPVRVHVTVILCGGAVKSVAATDHRWIPTDQQLSEHELDAKSCRVQHAAAKRKKGAGCKSELSSKGIRKCEQIQDELFDQHSCHRKKRSSKNYQLLEERVWPEA